MNRRVKKGEQHKSLCFVFMCETFYIFKPNLSSLQSYNKLSSFLSFYSVYKAYHRLGNFMLKIFHVKNFHVDILLWFVQSVKFS